MSDYESPIKSSTGGDHWPANQIPQPEIHVAKIDAGYLKLPTPYGSLIRRDVYSLGEGKQIVIEWPELNPETYKECDQWFQLVRRKMRRYAGIASEE